MPRETQIGKLVAEGERFFVDVGGKRMPLPAGQGAEMEELKALVGKEVTTYWTKPQSYLLAITPRRASVRIPWRCFICYLPPEWVHIREQLIQPEMRVRLLDQFAKEGLISPAVREKLVIH